MRILNCCGEMNYNERQRCVEGVEGELCDLIACDRLPQLIDQCVGFVSCDETGEEVFLSFVRFDLDGIGDDLRCFLSGDLRDIFELQGQAGLPIEDVRMEREMILREIHLTLDQNIFLQGTRIIYKHRASSQSSLLRTSLYQPTIVRPPANL